MFYLTFLSILSLSLIFATPSLAQCPVCIVTVGGGMILAEKLGIDSLLVNIWIGGLNTVIAYWLAPKIKNRVLSNPVTLSINSLIFAVLAIWVVYQFYRLKINLNATVKIINKLKGKTTLW